MNIILTGIIAGVLGTVAMDVLNHLFARTGMIIKIDVATIGRMAAGWLRGRFRYGHPGEMEQVANELFYGYLAHYAIGVSLALPFMLGWALLAEEAPSPVGTLVYGVATTAASWFFVYPSMGFGIMGLGSPEGIKAPFSSLANHLFFGIGMAVGSIFV